ncbi:MAG: DNA repair protein RadA [Thermodesulfovibrio sp. RBG_19FT_COMBO_41_18]|jgi:DNA repair protein RadA/Sms|nr:MAG: DNA repair protein RadA [Thermodesulfovibrio sp. RBG_19FT_COMBO_41_18]
MPKIKTFFQCQTCGYVSPKWLGRCPDCGAWNSLVEEKKETVTRHSSLVTHLGKSEPQPLSSITGEYGHRTSTGIKELDRVLGGGVVAGSVVLIGGDPGIGKSTLLLQALSGLSKEYGKVFYVSGEESPEQIKIRSERLSINSEEIILFSETSLEAIVSTASKLSPKAMVVDSIQTVYTEELVSAPGSVSQVRDCAAKLMLFAKRSDITVFLVGHVTKEGAIAGPRVLEHIVDTVLYFEGDRGHSYRMLRTVKNRFGSTNEIGIFEMSDSGLIEVKNPSELFLLERPLNVSGSTVVASLEGTRPLMVEIQSLVSQSNFGVPRRTTIGVDFNRVNLLVAVLEKRAGLYLGGMDIFVNVVGGLRIIEPAVDIGIITTIASSLKDIPVDPKIFVFGEVGLSGEIRAVTQAEARIKEASKIGFKRAVMPMGNAEKIKNNFGLEITGIKNVKDCLEAVFT